MKLTPIPKNNNPVPIPVKVPLNSAQREELRLYKIALRHYWLSLLLPIPLIGIYFKTNLGFCNYFRLKHKVSFDFIDLPTLYKLFDNEVHFSSMNPFWFNDTLLTSFYRLNLYKRITRLKRAIKTLES